MDQDAELDKTLLKNMFDNGVRSNSNSLSMSMPADSLIG